MRKKQNETMSMQEEKKTEKDKFDVKSDSNGAPEDRKKKKPLIATNDDEGGIFNFFWGLVFITILVGGAYATQPLWTPYIIDYFPKLKQADVDQFSDGLVEKQIDQLSEEISKVRKSGQAIADLEVERDRLNKSFEGVMTRIVEIEKKIEEVRGMHQATIPPSDIVNTNASLKRLSSRIQKLEKSDSSVNAVMERLNKLEQAMTNNAPNSNSNATELSQTMTEISNRVGALEKGVAQTGDSEINSGLEKQKNRAATLVLAVGHLREALRSSNPFSQPLQALKALGRKDPDIVSGVKELAPYAETGVHTLNMLQQDFKFVIEKINVALKKHQLDENSESFFKKALKNLTSLVSVKKMNPGDLSTSETNLVKIAYTHLSEGNLEKATLTLSKLRGPEGAAVAPWLAKARERVVAENVISRLHVFVLSILVPTNH